MSPAIPLPLTDGCFLIDNSTLETLNTCPRAMQYSKLHRRISSGNKPSLNFGSAIHKALEYRYLHHRNKPADASLLEAQALEILKHFDTSPAEEDDYRTSNWAIELIKKYNDAYKVEPFNLLVDDKDKILCELSFALPLFDFVHEGLPFEKSIPVIYIGRIDLAVQWDGGVWILDHKTTSMLGAQYFESMSMSAQQLGYVWAFQELTKQKCQGFVINAIRVKQPPLKPRDGLDAWWRESFQRQRFHVMPEQIVEWKANTIALVKEFFYHYLQSYFPMKSSWCVGKYGRCQYFDVCTLPLTNRETMLASALFTDNNWSPLK